MLPLLLITAVAAEQPADGPAAPVDRSSLEDLAEVTFTLSAPDSVQPGQPIPARVLAINDTDKAMDVDLAYSLQRDSALYSAPLPDSVMGSNHAPGLKSWTEADGKTIETGSVTAWTVDGTAKLGLDLEICEITDAFGARLQPENTASLDLTPFPV